MTSPLTDAVPLDDVQALDDRKDQAITDAGAAAQVDDDDGAQPHALSEQDAQALAAIADDPDDDDDGNGRASQSGRVPQWRVNEIAEARKAAEAAALAREQENTQLREMLQQAMGGKQVNAAAPTARDFDAEFAALQARFENGEIDDNELRREERKLGVAQAKAEMAAEYEPQLRALAADRERAQQAQVAEAWTREVQTAIKAYPFLNHEGAEANKKAIDAVRAECEELMRAGIAAPKALRLAVRDVAPQFGDAAPPTPDDVAAARRKKAREALADAENRQPSQLGGAGNGQRVQGKQRLTSSVKDFDKWERTPEEQREQTFSA